MARGVNKVILVGTVGKDPDHSAPASGDSNLAITNISLATNEQWKDKNTGEKKESTEWHRIVFFGKLAEIVKIYVRKGQQLYVEGSIRTRKWKGQDGQDRYTTEIVASDMQMLGGRPNDGERNSAPMNQGGSYNQAPRNNNYSNNNNSNQNSYQPSSDYAPSAPSGKNNFEDFDDDIPF